MADECEVGEEGIGTVDIWMGKWAQHAEDEDKK
jgi:hypothetical protein